MTICFYYVKKCSPEIQLPFLFRKQRAGAFYTRMRDKDEERKKAKKGEDGDDSQEYGEYGW